MNPPHKVVTRDEWLAARKQLLRKEKELTRERDRLAEQRRELPWVKVDQDYVFDGADGPVTLGELFNGQRQLIVYHFMFAPEWSQGCKSCSLLADHYNPSAVHLAHRDTTLVTISRAPIDKLLAFRDRMGWTFPWVSSEKNSFHTDFGVYFTPQELESGLSVYNYEAAPYPITDLPGLSVFTRDDDGSIYHSYSTYARGLDMFINVYNLLDTTPLGRNEAGMTNMDWLRHHDRYGVPGFVDPWLETAAVQPGAM
jgi:predicted dithiol-disulfide oxidoreductase (DUF899 family)